MKNKTLAEILLLIQKLNQKKLGLVIVNNCRKNFLGIGYNPINDSNKLIEIFWNLKKTTVEKQSKATQKKLEILLKHGKSI